MPQSLVKNRVPLVYSIKHHRKLTFQEELRALLTRHGIEFESDMFGMAKIVVPFQGDERGVTSYPGRRFALPWAIM